MVTEALVIEPKEEIQPTETTVHLVARNPNEMALAKTSLEMWLKNKIKQSDDEASELFDATEHARIHKWKHETLAKHANLARRRAQFYEKALKAVEAGYTLVPNFPVDVFAVRVKRATPLHDQETSTYSKANAISKASDIAPAVLPIGEGQYVSPTPMGRTGDFIDKSTGKDVKTYFFTTTDYTDVVFPMEAARVEVMSATSEAMAMRVFDSIGISPQSRKGDPLIIGTILGPKHGYQQKEISFLIAWHLDLRTL